MVSGLMSDDDRPRNCLVDREHFTAGVLARAVGVSGCTGRQSRK